jgi:hypothetical protein
MRHRSSTQVAAQSGTCALVDVGSAALHGHGVNQVPIRSVIEFCASRQGRCGSQRPVAIHTGRPVFATGVALDLDVPFVLVGPIADRVQGMFTTQARRWQDTNSGTEVIDAVHHVAVRLPCRTRGIHAHHGERW